MKKDIKSADLKVYNANSRGNNAPDCVKRAISLAFDISYNETGKLLNEKMKKLRWSAWNKLPVFRRVIEDLGGGDLIDETAPNITVNDFADQHPQGVYILLTGKKDGGMTHLVTVRDGKVWDSWDSRKYFVTSYWEVGSTRKELRDTDKNFMKSVGNDYALPAVHDEIIRYMNKKKWIYSDASTDLATVSSYSVAIRCRVNLFKDETIKKDRHYSFDVILVVEPTWTEDEVIAFIQKSGKQKTYDRMWTINEQEKKLKEAAEIENQLDSPVDQSRLWISSQEDKFLNTLPGWVRPLTQYISIQQPGQYMDSYQIRIKKLPGDTKHPDDDSFTFEAETADDMREMLLEYKNNGRVEGIDYNWWDEH